MTAYSNNQRAVRYRQPVPDVLNQLVTERIVHEKLRIVGPVGTENRVVLEGFETASSSSDLHINDTNSQTGGVELMLHKSIDTDSPTTSCHNKGIRFIIKPKVRIHATNGDPDATKCVGTMYIPPGTTVPHHLARFLVAMRRVLFENGAKYGFELFIMFYSMNSPAQVAEYKESDKSQTNRYTCAQYHRLAMAAATILGGMNLQVSNDHQKATKVLSLSNCVTDTIFASFTGNVDHGRFIQASGSYSEVQELDYFAQPVPGYDGCIYEDLVQEFISETQVQNISWLRLIKHTCYVSKTFPKLSEQETTTFCLAVLVRHLEFFGEKDITYLATDIQADSPFLQLTFEQRDKFIKSLNKWLSQSICRCTKNNRREAIPCIREECLLKEVHVECMSEVESQQHKNHFVCDLCASPDVQHTFKFSTNHLMAVRIILNNHNNIKDTSEIMSWRTSDGKSMLDVNTKIEQNYYYEVAEAFVDMRNQLLMLREKYDLHQINNLQRKLFHAWEARGDSKYSQKRINAWVS